MGARPRAATTQRDRGARVVSVGPSVWRPDHGPAGAQWLRSLTAYPAFVNRPRWWHWADRAVGWALALLLAAAWLAESLAPATINFTLPTCAEPESELLDEPIPN